MASTLYGNPTSIWQPASSPLANSLSVYATHVTLFGCPAGVASFNLDPDADLAEVELALPPGSWCAIRFEGLFVEGAYALPGGPGGIELGLGARVLQLPAGESDLVVVTVDVSALLAGAPAPLRPNYVLTSADASAEAAAAAIGLQVSLAQ